MSMDNVIKLAVAAAIALIPALPAPAQEGGSDPSGIPDNEQMIIEKSKLAPADRELLLAAVDGDLDRLAAAARKGGSVNAEDSTGGTALWYAAVAGDRAMAEALIRLGADVNCRHPGRGGASALTAAVGHGRDEVAEILLRSGARPDNPRDLERAILDGREDLAFLLLEKGAPLDADRLRGSAPLVLCVRAGRSMALARRLIAGGADVNARGEGGYTALHYAIARNNHELVELLLEKKARTDVRSDDCKTPLDIVREAGDDRMRKMFGLR